MSTQHLDREGEFYDLIEEVHLSKSGGAEGSKYDELRTWLSRRLDIDRWQVWSATAVDAKSVIERFGANSVLQGHREVCLLLLSRAEVLEYAAGKASDYIKLAGNGYATIGLVTKNGVSWKMSCIVGVDGRNSLVKLSELFPAAETVLVTPQDPSYVASANEFHKLVEPIELSSRAKNKYSELNEFVASVLHVEPDRVYTSTGNSSMLPHRMTQGEEARKKHHDFGLYLLQDSVEAVEGALRSISEKGLIGPGEGRYDAIAVAIRGGEGRWIVRAVAEGGIKAESIRALFPDVEVRSLSPETTVVRYEGETTTSVPIDADEVADHLVVDERVRRMIRLAISSSRAVMLVGPPGTAKTMLLTEVIREIEKEPASFGLSKPWNARWVTPEESWTTRDLLGGETVDEEANLRFRPGYVLESIRKNEWLVLDEANRADMDKIFGGLLTWLSGKSVTLGRASTAVDAPAVELGWAQEAECRVENEAGLGLSGGGAGSTIRFVAGSEWRLLGTYNALDAQRVFRFGQALGRRFVRVPIPLATTKEFAQILDPLLENLPSLVGETVRGLYRVHRESANLALGPALFLWIPRYVRKGLEAYGSTEVGAASTAGDTEPDIDSSLSETTNEGGSARNDLIPQLVAEAYLSAAGAWLANAEEGELDDLGQEILDQKIMTEKDWIWLRGLLSAMR